MEKDDELKGSGNSYDFGARIYDSRIGRFLSIDPKASFLPGIAPYQFAFNNPLLFIDENGEFPITPEQTKALVEAFVQALFQYSGEIARRDFEDMEERRTHVTLPDEIAVKVEKMRKYTSGAYYTNNELEGRAQFTVNGASSSAHIHFKLTKGDENIIKRTEGEGKSDGYLSAERYRYEFISDGIIIGVLEFNDTEEGKAAFKELKGAVQDAYNKEYYRLAIRFDKKHNYEYGNKNSLQTYYDTYYPEYKKAYEQTVNIEVTEEGATISAE